MLNLLLVKPPNPSLNSLNAIEPPLWATLMANDFRNQGKDVAILDAQADRLNHSQTLTEMSRLNPREIIIVAMGNNPSVASTPMMIEAERLGRELKHDIPVRLTGLHPMALPELTKERTGCEVLNWYPNPELSPAYDLLDLSKYRAHNWHCLEDIDNRSPYGIAVTSYGCPFSCFYCNIHVLYNGERKIIERSIDSIVRDLETLANCGVRHIKFWDELFCLRRNRVDSICKSIIERKWNFNIWAYARPDTVTFELLNTMKEVGINWLAYGLDNKCPNKTIIKAIRMTHDAGINVIGNFLFGLPSETPVDKENTLIFAESLGLEWVNFYVALPYPGSDWYRSLKIPITDWGWYSQYNRNGSEYRDYAFSHFFRRPEYIELIGRKFGVKAVDHIKQMLSFNIRSKI